MSLEIKITFPHKKRVDADFGDFVIHTDQKEKNGGDGSAPKPYDLFLASIGTCAGYYVMAFCDTRKIPFQGISLVQRHTFSEPGHVLSRVELEIRVPTDFPEKYRKSLIHAASACGVKKAIAQSPEFVIETKVTEED